MRMRWVSSGLLMMLALVGVCAAEAETAPEEHGPEKFNIFAGDLAEAIWVLVAFGLLLVVLWRLAWKPLLAALQSREEYIQKQIDDAEKVRKDAEQVLSDYRSRLEDAERQGRSIVEQHSKEAEKRAGEIIARAQQDIEAMRVRLETEIERSRREAQKELLAQSGEIILSLGREILGKNIETQDNLRLIDEAVARLEEEGRRQEAS